jgi:hypothetical protein
MRNESDAKELREVLDTLSDNVLRLLDTLSDKIPALVRGVVNVLYSKEAAENMAESVGTFYKKLVEAGIPREDALDMTRGYMVNLRDVIRSKGLNVGYLKKSAKDDEEEV